MQILEDELNINLLLEQLTQAGFLQQRLSPTSRYLYRWTLSQGGSFDSYLHTDRKRYWGIDLSRMLTLYQDIYQKIYAKRLDDWGISDHNDVGLLYIDSLLLIWGSDELISAKKPASVALQKIETADNAWVVWLERWWHQTAIGWEKQLDNFWLDLCQGNITVEAFQSFIEGKVNLNSIGVDSLIPARQQVEAWLSPYIASSFIKDVVDGCFLPASGYIAYDVLEVECWKLAEAFQSSGKLPEAVRVHFIKQGLFYLYEALNNNKKNYFFSKYPLETATKYSQSALGSKAIRERIENVQQRNWQRRYHHEWAKQQIEAIDVLDVRKKLLVLHHLLGTARDFDEEKRRLNMKFWRSLFALADGLNIPLTHPQTNLSYLCNAINLSNGNVMIDSIFTASTNLNPHELPE
jgi:hypothetical protein